MNKIGTRDSLIFLIILSGLLLRLWHFQDWFYFAIDEEKGAYITRGIATLSHFPTVGHPSSIGFRLGPGLYFALAPFFALFGSAPPVWGYISVVCSIASMILIYIIGNRLGRFTGVYALILYAFSYLNTIYDRRGWQVSFHSLIALVVLYALIALKRGKTQYWYVLTAALIAATHVEVATVLFVPLVILCLVLFRLPAPRRTIAICAVLFCLSHVPLLIFDLRHDFLNSRYLLNYFRHDTSIRIAKNKPLTGERSVYLGHNLIPATLARTLYNPTAPNLALQYANCPQYLGAKQSVIGWGWRLLILVIFCLFFFMAMKRGQKKDQEKRYILRIISVYFAIIFGGIIVYTYGFHGEMAEYYLLSVFAYFFLAVAVLLDTLLPGRLRWFAALLLVIFVWHNAPKIFASTNPYGYRDKVAAISYAIDQVGNNPFIVESFPTCWYSGGYRYLFTLAGKEPTTSYMDQFMSEYYPPDTTTKPEYQVTVLTPELVGENPQGYEAFRQKIFDESEAMKKFGEIEVYITNLKK